ncbi:MAG: hypothetical protein JXJ04_08290 [Spirochaetales bacterium]|nr:hypothetical protein [Spirochaetales bacterium]
MKKAGLLFLIFLYFTIIVRYPIFGETVIFDFALSLSDQNGNTSPVPWEKNNKIYIPAGKMLKFYFRPIQNAFLYLYYLDSDNYLELIFPASFTVFEKAYSWGNHLFIPTENKWFLIDGKVRFDKFYIFVFKHRMIRLEELTNNFVRCTRDTAEVDINIQLQSKHELLEEIKQLLNKSSPNEDHDELVEIIPFSGTIKAVEEEIAQFAKKIEVKEFYAKTIEMEH